VLENLGLVDIIDGDPPQARYHFIDSLEVARLTGVKSLVPGALLGLALAASASGEHTAAVTLHGVADEHYERAGQPFEVIEEGLRERDHAHLRAMLSDAAFEKAYRHGRTLHQADAIALATAAGASEISGVASGADPAGGQVTADGSTGVLSAREREIVALVAGGATDGQIAERLFLSINTVRSHLERIRDKTGARRRPELVRYAIKAGIQPVSPSI
jgi:DNA-binding CsgD family transcriptional regulator